MVCQLPTDCLNDIFEYLEEDKVSLRSCLLVNCLWCEVAVRILWNNPWNFKYNVHYPNRTRVSLPSAILSTLIACLPKESKDILYVNGIFIPPPTSKPPLFNYISFSKVLSIDAMNQTIADFLVNKQVNDLNNNKHLLLRELLKTFMNQISSLKALEYSKEIQNTPFINFSGAKDCLTGLSAFSCYSNLYSSFFHQLSQLCHNIQTLTIVFENNKSNELKELISLQNNLKHLELITNGYEGWTGIIPALTKHHDTLKKLYIQVYYGPLSFITSFKNLQELVISTYKSNIFNEFHHVTFSKLRVLKVSYGCLKDEFFTKFLENNGENLIELNVLNLDKNNRSSIVQFCPNLKKFFTPFRDDELNLLKTMFHGCPYLEGIIAWCGSCYLNEKKMLEAIAKYSPKSFHELKIYNDVRSELFPEDLESFFISWGNRKPLTLIIINNYNNGLNANQGNITTIEKYKKLGIIKEFRAERFKLFA